MNYGVSSVKMMWCMFDVFIFVFIFYSTQTLDSTIADDYRQWKHDDYCPASSMTMHPKEKKMRTATTSSRFRFGIPCSTQPFTGIVQEDEKWECSSLRTRKTQSIVISINSNLNAINRGRWSDRTNGKGGTHRWTSYFVPCLAQFSRRLLSIAKR